MTSEQILQRSDILNTQVITRDTGKRLGIIKELLVDIDQRKVVALGLRDNLLSIAGMPRYMLLSSVRQMGDVILVDNDDVIEDIDVEAYSSLINSEVITETGELLGKVRGFKFDGEDGRVFSLIIASLGLPQIPDQVVSTYELPIDEIVSSGPNRLIVFEGSEARLVQLTVGLLERLGIGKAPWERDEEEAYFQPTVRPENQLPTGIPVNAKPATSIRASAPVIEEARWSEDEEYWEEPEPQPIRAARRAESIYYEEDEEEDNWSEATTETRRVVRYEEERTYVEPEPYEDEYEEDEYEEKDVWEDAEEPPYKAPRINIPEKTKAPEYEDGGY